MFVIDTDKGAKMESPITSRVELPLPSGGRADAARNPCGGPQNLSWVPARELANELGVCLRTLKRWVRDENLAFPQPRYINQRSYFSRGDIEDWKTATAVKAAGGR